MVKHCWRLTVARVDCLLEFVSEDSTFGVVAIARRKDRFVAA